MPPYSFTGTGRDDWLKDKGISSVTITGSITQMGCDITARGWRSNGWYSVTIMSDATGTLSVSNAAGSITAADFHGAILVTQQRRFSRVMKTGKRIMGI